MRSVRNAIGMVRDGAKLDALAAHEILGGVKNHFVGVHVAVVVLRRSGIRVEVIQPRTEGADHESVPLEGLVLRRRRMVNRPMEPVIMSTSVNGSSSTVNGGGHVFTKPMRFVVKCR